MYACTCTHKNVVIVIDDDVGVKNGKMHLPREPIISRICITLTFRVRFVKIKTSKNGREKET